MGPTRCQRRQPMQSQPVRRVSVTTGSESDLCKRCERINLDRVFQRKHLTKVGKPVHSLGPIRKWSAHSCPLCQLMLQIVPDRERGFKNYELRSLSSNRIVDRGWQAIDITMLTVSRSSIFLLKQSDDAPVVRLIQPNINPELIKNWLRYCQDNHSTACSGGDEQSLFKSTRSPFSAISSFKVIDCDTRQIVRGGRTQYVALSYVWGEGERAPEFSQVLPPQLPPTIEDAIAVTRSLGILYLWVDRYCIDQSRPTEVREQVEQMDLIYSSAYLTIVAAAGETPSHGLPGVGNRIRQPQPHGMVQGHMLISASPDPRDEIKASKWFQRGWTYQEGLLSPRRLIFTDHQIYFECFGMYCCEALNLPLPNLHTQNGQRFKAKFCEKINIGMFPRGIGTSEWEIVQRIKDYTERQLTNPSDILNGLSGILQAFRRSKKRMLHCAGVPMISAPSKRKRRQSSEPILRKWSPLAGFCGGLCWQVTLPTERREGFPSWSWTGWRGKISWQITDDYWYFIEPNNELQLSIQLKDGRVVGLEAFCHSYDDMSMNISDTLHVATWTFSLRIWGESRYLSSSLECEAIVELEDKEEPCIWKFSLTGTTPIPANSMCIGIHLCHIIEGEPARCIYVLVLREVKSGVYERVGLGEMAAGMQTISEYMKYRYMGTDLWSPLPVPKKEWKEFQLF